MTGGTTGIGRAAAALFRDEGATVIVTGTSDANLAAVREDLGIEAILSDIADLGQIDALMHHIADRHDRLDIVFANAGIPGPQGSLDQITVADFDQVVAVNMRGLFFTVVKALPLMGTGGAIVLTSSIGAHVGMAHAPVYAASKAAVRSLGRSLAAALVERNIRVNTLTPGFFKTPLFDKIGVDGNQLQKFTAEVPMQRAGELHEAARAALFLASNDSSYVTGSELRVAGGQTDI